LVPRNRAYWRWISRGISRRIILGDHFRLHWPTHIVSGDGRHFCDWHDIHSEYDIGDRAGLIILYNACAALDRAEALAEAIKKDGPMIYTKNGGVQVNSGIKLKIAARSFVTRSLQRLGLNFEPVRGPGRPPMETHGIRMND
jgi:hypothetical protein